MAGRSGYIQTGDEKLNKIINIASVYLLAIQLQGITCYYVMIIDILGENKKRYLYEVRNKNFGNDYVNRRGYY